MAKLSIFLLSLLCLVSPVISSYLTNKIYQWTKNAESYTSAGKWLQNHQFFFTSKVMVTQCAYECLKRPTCKSFNFDRGEEKCQLNRKTHEQSPTDYVNASLGKEYHTRDAYSIDQEALGPCAGDPCSGKGRCLETKTTAEDLIAICLCEKGWTGSKCHLQAQVPEWGAWQDWGDCSVTCDRGWRVRKRNCEDTANSKTLDPLECYGHDVEYGACVKQECPRWREWGEWGTCSKYKSCGRGFKVRHRLCTNGGTPGVDRYCLGPTNETAPCYDIDCRGPLRLRGGSKHGEGRVEVFNDKRNEWGLVCADQWTMFAANLTCKQIGLPGAFAPVTDGRFSSGGMKYGITSLTCNQSERTLQMCERNPWSLANSCSGSTKSAGVQCQVNGVWSLWNSWGDCSVTCENGIRQRTRQCNHPPALHGGKPCVGDSVQSKPCTLSACPIDGEWREWQTWSACSETCGNGTQYRTRTCKGPFYGGRNCTGIDDDSRGCKDRECPVDGTWLSWADWGHCNVTCGGGQQFRRRDCQNPKYGGKPCSGANQEMKECNTYSCPVDGKWTDWGEWSNCTRTCGNGTQTRNRTCNGPFHGGKACEGSDKDMKHCNTHSCAVDGVWKMWGSWGACDVTCGGGLRRRMRECNGPFYGGKECNGAVREEEKCNDHKCPVDGKWESWMAWGDCSAKCYGGTQWRHRNCTGPFYGGKDCDGPNDESQDCNMHNCPVDGYFNAWGSWSNCDVTCGGGIRWRNRTCIGPFYGGADCEGSRNDTETCNTHNCPVDGVFENWLSWMVCSVSCGGGIRWRYRNCTGPFYGGEDCKGPREDSQKCNEHNCPVDGVYLKWSSWSDCTLSCGGGTHWRSRTCLGPFHSGKPCDGPDKETGACNTQNCPVDGFFSDWSEWSTCSVTCGGGSQSRNRSCTQPKYGGHDCEGPPIETQDCNTFPCPVDGKWKAWSDWGPCNTTCGGGFKQRMRQCNPPKHGGSDCAGEKAEFLSCSTNPCPIPGDWFEWVAWTPCSVTCGGGKKERSRECNMKSHGDLTAPCEGVDKENVDCHTFPCKPLVRTCSEWGKLGLEENTMADIDPDGADGTLEPTTVYCDMLSENGTGVTVIGHADEEEQEVAGYEGAGEYDLQLNYNVTFEHAIAVVDASKFCRQFLRWKCKAALIHNPNGNGAVTTGWRNRTGGDADYFAGATPGSDKCACGMTKTCADKTLPCNCDMNDEVWREDSGYLTYKPDLPIKEFFAGDTGEDHTEEGIATIGRLLCTGVAT